MMRTASTAASRGFTLVEVLIALFVMAMMSALAWRGIEGVLRARDVSQAAVDRSALLATVLSQWETDFQSLHADAGVPRPKFDGRALRMARLADDGVQIVVWSLDGSVLRRWASATSTRQGELQQAWLRSQQLQNNDPGQVLLLEGVSTWNSFRWLPNDNTWSNWQSSGDLESATASPAPAAVEQLPRGVRLVLTLDDKVLTRDILVAPAS